MRLTSAQSAELLTLVSSRTGRARVRLTGTSMRPLLKAGMVLDVEPLVGRPRLGDVLVFESREKLVAHRFVSDLKYRDEKSVLFITAGDATPNVVERVSPRLVIGRVAAVWSSGATDARRIDGPFYRLAAALLPRTRKQRALIKELLTCIRLFFADPASVAPPAAFAALVAATHAFENKLYAAGVAALCSVPQKSVIDMALRHKAGGIVALWLQAASRAGVSVPHDLYDAFRRDRWTNALQAGRVVDTVRDVRDRFVEAGIPHIFLKGGARLACGEAGAAMQYSEDVDVLVPAEMAVRACDTLRSADYRDLFDERRVVYYEEYMHQHAPLAPPFAGVPVEVHWVLMEPGTVGQQLDFRALETLSRHADGPLGAVCVLDEVGSALHLAYHARDLHGWRDVVLLARRLRSFDTSQRARFDAYVNRETHDGLRLRSVVAAAEEILVGYRVGPPAVKRYLAWATVREDLPTLLARCEVLEVLLGSWRCRDSRLVHVADLRNLLNRARTRTVMRKLLSRARTRTRSLFMLPAIARIALWRTFVSKK